MVFAGISPFDITAGLRLITSVPMHLRRRPTLADAHALVTARVQRRSQLFLRQLHWLLESHGGPRIYRDLFRWAACDYGDVALLVERDGLESALHTLFTNGIHLSVEELKGRAPVRRGSWTATLDSADVWNPRARPSVPGRSSGSRGRGTPVFFDIDFVRDAAMDLAAVLDAWGGSRWRKAIWSSPGASGQYNILVSSSFGSPADRWFSHVSDLDPGLPPRYRWSSRAIVWSSRLTSSPIPMPVVVPFASPEPVAHWLHEIRQRGETPFLQCFASAGVALCQEAMARGIDISGSRLLVTGEPFTPARKAALQSAGVFALSRYSSSDAGYMGYGCLNPRSQDEVHVIDDMLAIIGKARAPGESAALHVTSLSPHAPKVLINASLGDHAMLDTYACGCPLEGLGWRTHVRTIRSAEKLTAAGSNLLDVDIVQILEEILPAAFGGTGLDYQLVDDQSEDGRARVRLVVSPSVGAVDPAQVSRVFRDAVASAGGAEHIMMRIWESDQTLRVERRAPYPTHNGKVNHIVHVPPGT